MNESYVDGAVGYDTGGAYILDDSVALPSLAPASSQLSHDDSVSPMDLLVAASSVAHMSRTHCTRDIRILQEELEESEGEYEAEEETEEETEEAEENHASPWRDQDELAEAAATEAANDADAEDINRLIQSEQEKQDNKRRKL